MGRERCLPLEHSDLNDIEKSVAQAQIRLELLLLYSKYQHLNLNPKPQMCLHRAGWEGANGPGSDGRKEIADLVANIMKETEERIAEEKAQAAKARALTDALSRSPNTAPQSQTPNPVCPSDGLATRLCIDRSL